jgi:hypothetical protein
VGVVLNDSDAALLDGGIALVCEEGLIMTDEVKVISGVPNQHQLASLCLSGCFSNPQGLV